jgi:hypothetical protein
LKVSHKGDYKTRRAYPNFEDYLDAVVKIARGGSEVKAEGEDQLERYYDGCWEQKTKFPKE